MLGKTIYYFAIAMAFFSLSTALAQSSTMKYKVTGVEGGHCDDPLQTNPPPYYIVEFEIYQELLPNCMLTGSTQYLYFCATGVIDARQAANMAPTSESVCPDEVKQQKIVGENFDFPTQLEPVEPGTSQESIKLMVESKIANLMSSSLPQSENLKTKVSSKSLSPEGIGGFIELDYGYYQTKFIFGYQGGLSSVQVFTSKDLSDDDLKKLLRLVSVVSNRKREIQIQFFETRTAKDSRPTQIKTMTIEPDVMESLANPS